MLITHSYQLARRNADQDSQQIRNERPQIRIPIPLGDEYHDRHTETSDVVLK